ncbi:hypothetical protein L0152_04810 [bacterium]|nr:hypothetical protein [bacterium]
MYGLIIESNLSPKGSPVLVRRGIRESETIVNNPSINDVRFDPKSRNVRMSFHQYLPHSFGIEGPDKANYFLSTLDHSTLLPVSISKVNGVPVKRDSFISSIISFANGAGAIAFDGTDSSKQRMIAPNGRPTGSVQPIFGIAMPKRNLVNPAFAYSAAPKGANGIVFAIEDAENLSENGTIWAAQIGENGMLRGSPFVVDRDFRSALGLKALSLDSLNQARYIAIYVNTGVLNSTAGEIILLTVSE